jgi:methyl-accepting chemotaxis protein
VSALLTAFRGAQLAASQQDVADDRAAAATMLSAMLWGGLAATLLAAAVAAWLVRAVLDQLGAEPRVAVKLVQRVGAGDLGSPIILKAGDTHSLMAHLQAMQKGLCEVVTTVRHQSQRVEEACAVIESGSNDLSSRTSAQASSLEETAASMEQLKIRVSQNAEGARQATQRAGAASTLAVQGGELVAQFVDTMQGINESSGKIADIIGVIDGIAFQTNILALNAAVEAARAGEQGRGFAVVASEVRTLAGRSAEAAKAIKGLISASADRVDQGSTLVARARVAMTDVVGGIRNVSDTMGEITTASAEQSAGVAQVCEAVGRMDQMTQQNASLVEQSATAAGALRQQAHALAQAVAVFRLPADTAA